MMMLFKYIIKNTANEYGKTATFMPKPIIGDNGSGMHCHMSLWKDGSPLFYDEVGYAGLSDMARYYIGGLLHHAPSLLAFTNPTVNSYHRLVPGLRGAGQPGLQPAQPLGLHPHPDHRLEPEGQAPGVPLPRPVHNPYLAFSAMLMAGLDGIKNKIEPPVPVDKDLYELPPEELADVAQVPASLDAVLDALEADHDYLLEGGVFTEDLIETWIAYKREQRDRRAAPAAAPVRVRSSTTTSELPAH